MSKDFTTLITWRPRRPRSQERPKTAKNTRRSTCAIVSLLVGLFSLLIALMCAFFRAPIRDMADLLIRQQFALTSDSMMTPLWMSPPLVPKLQGIHYYTKTYDRIRGKSLLELWVTTFLPD